MLDHFFPLLFPKDSESLKIFDIRFWELGAKRPLNGTSKVNTHTDRQTDKRTDRRTFRLTESIGPEGQCFEKIMVIVILSASVKRFSVSRMWDFKKLLAVNSKKP